MTGDSNNDTLVVRGGADTLSAGGGNHTFVLSATQRTGTTVTGGSGSDTLVGPNATNSWVVNGSNSGTVDGWSFAAVSNLTGGSGNDSFQFSGSGALSGTLDRGLGSNWLDYSALSTGVTVNLTTGTASNVTGAVFNIQNVLGGSGTNNLTGDSLGNILIGGSGQGTITGGTGTDILIAGTVAMNDLQLMAILAELQSADNFAQKVSDMNGMDLRRKVCPANLLRPVNRL